MKNLILCISLLVLLLGMSLCELAFTNNIYASRISPYLAVWVLAQGIFFLRLGIRMSGEVADYRIAAVVLFLFGQLIMLWFWDGTNDEEGVGLAMGKLTIFLGLIWGLCDHYTKQELKEVKNRSD